MLSDKQRKHFLVILLVLSLATMTFFAIGIQSFKRQQAQKASFWKEVCVITECIAATPSKDRVTFQSYGHFARNNTTTLASGCRIYPINSTITCYVNADIVTLEKPGAAGEWIAWMVFGGIFGTAIFVLLFVWFLEECVLTSTPKYSALPTNASVVTPGNPEDNETFFSNSIALEEQSTKSSNANL